MPTSPLEALPTELLIAITDHLPNGHAVLLLRHVSKTLYDILSSHDVVSHALVSHYPHSAEARFALPRRTKAVFDAVVRRSYTQPRRRSPRSVSELHGYPLICSEEDQVLVYQTAAQKEDPNGWSCTLWDLQDDDEVTVEISSMVGGCYNEQGELFRSAVVNNVWCELGRGVMVVGGRHRHGVVFMNGSDIERGPYTNQKVELGYHGIHIAPRLCKHEHTFLHVYSLHRHTLGLLLSTFSFYGATSLTHTAANTHIFASLSTGSLFIYTLQPPLHTLQPPTSPSPSLWRDFAYSTSTTALTADTAGTHLFIYSDPGINGFYDRGTASVLVVSTATGNTLKKVVLGDSRALFEYRLERDDSRLWEWRFERACRRVVGVGGEEGEEVAVSWTGTYGVFGTRGARVGLEGLDSRGRFTGAECPVMVEWRVNTFAVEGEGEGAREKVGAVMYHAPSEVEGGGGGVMELESLLVGFEEVARGGLVRWPVTVASYRLVGKQGGMVKWGMGERGYYTSAGRGRVREEGRAVSLWFERKGGLVVPRWKQVLEVQGGDVDNGCVFEGCGWILYRLLKKRDWREEERRKGVPEVEVVEYDSDLEIREGVEEEEEEEEEGDVVDVRGVEGVGDKLVVLRF